MKRNLLNVLSICLMLGIAITANAGSKTFNHAGCSVAGIASASKDSICDNDSTTLLLSGYVGAIQWQSFDGVSWINETGPGSTTDAYAVTLVASTDFRAVVTEAACPPDTSNTMSIVVGVTAPSTTGATRCGYGQVTVSATSPGNSIKWYDAATGGNQLGSGPTYTTNVGTTTSFYAAAISNGGGAGTAPLPAQVNIYTAGQSRGLWFTAPVNFTIIGLLVPPMTGTMQNLAVLSFTGAVPPPAYPTVTNAFTILFITQNNTASGMIPVNISVNAGDVIGILGTRTVGANNETSYGPAPSAFISDIAGIPVTFSRMGMQFPLSVTSPMDIWEEPGGSLGRIEITYEVGCESARVAAVATVTPADTVAISAGANALCLGQSTVLTATSNNPGYNYTWSPPTGLSSTFGAIVTATPTTTITYQVIGDDGTCADIDSITISVGPASVAGTATISTDTICLGTNATLTLTGYTGSIQWQSYDGSNWVNETGVGNNTPSYIVSPPAAIQYRAVITSGGCAPDTSGTLSLEVIAITDPVTVNDTICGPGIVNLTATGAGVLSWYAAPTGGTSFNTGGSYSPNISTTTTYYVEASAGGTINVGPPTNGIGSQIALAGTDWGLQFDVTQQVTIDKVYIYPGVQNGNVTINLRASMGGPILNTVTTGVTAFSGKTPINLGFIVNPGTGYRLEMATGSVQCYYNSTGAIYPYTTAGGPLTIMGYINPNFQTGAFYYFFYDWVVTEGCKSNRIPVTGVVLTVPPVPTINVFGNQLTSSSPTNNQWNLNGVPILGATNQVYIVTQPGNYTVTVTDPNGCSSTSAPVFMTGIEELNTLSGITVYPNPFTGSVLIEIISALKSDAQLKIYNALGEAVHQANVEIKNASLEIDLIGLAKGSYLIEIKNNEGIYRKSIIKL
ncbi:MAG: T9SS type A sorting domain-containing protein [Bacteroidia bacterium]